MSPQFVLKALILLTIAVRSFSFQSDELLVDDDEFGLEGAPSRPVPVPDTSKPTTTTTRRRSSDSDSDSKVQFTLEHAFGGDQFSPAGTFSARLKSWSSGSQTLTKLRFSSNSLTNAEKEKFKVLLQEDDFYKIRLPSNVLNPPGRNYTVSVVKARCLAREALDEHFIIHMEGANILAVNYGSPRTCPYPRFLKFPSKWTFNSYPVLKYSELAPRSEHYNNNNNITSMSLNQIKRLPQKWSKGGRMYAALLL